MATPYVTISCDEVSSTQDRAAAELQRSGRPVLIVASRQTAGRGRSSNEWWQAPRAVSASLAFENGLIPVGETFSLAVGLAVRSALTIETNVDISLKWPNDLELAGDKIGGILVERDGMRTVVGCGLNLWWPDPPPGVAALATTDPGDAIGLLISEAWASALIATKGQWNRDAYRGACSTLGEDLTWEPDGRGRAVDVDDRGGLVVTTRSGEVTLRSGEVQTVRRTV